MEFIFLVGGVLAGSILTNLLGRRNKICGIIDVDRHNNLCKIHITSDELSNIKNKKVIFTINHDAIISREEQTL